MKGYVYQLVCPIRKKPVYIGSTIKFLKTRLSEHISRIRRRDKSPIYKYFVENDSLPEIELLEKCVDFNTVKELRIKEQEWIRRIIDQGICLLNKNNVIREDQIFSAPPFGTLVHTTCKLHPMIFIEICKRVEKKEFPSFNAGMNKLLLKALKIKLQKQK